MPTIAVHVGTRLRAAREQAGLTQRGAAEAVGVTQGSLHGWENGSQPLPVRRAFALADLYRVTLDELLGYPAPTTEGH